MPGAATPRRAARKLAREGLGASVKRGGSAGKTPADSEKGTEAHEVQLPFRLEMKRPRKSRFEVDFAGKTPCRSTTVNTAGNSGPISNRDDVEAFTADEAKSEASKADLEGPLVDYAAKGTQIALEGIEPVDGHNAYKLKLTLKNGNVQHIWIDAQSFLDVKVDGAPRRMDGKMRSVWISQRDFRSVQGLMVALSVRDRHRRQPAPPQDGYRIGHRESDPG